MIQRFFLFSIFWLTCIFYNQQPTQPTALSRLLLLQSIILRGTLNINHDHVRTPDKAFYKGNYFSDKAPGTLIFLWPGFLVGSLLCGINGIPLGSLKGEIITTWFSCGLGIAVIASLGGVLFWDLASRFVSPHFALLATCAVFLGAGPFTYVTMLFSHGLVFGLLAISLWCLSMRPFKGYQNIYFRIGYLSLGLALASEFSSGIIVLAVLSLHYRGLGNMGNILALVLPLFLIPIYNLVCFENIFQFGYKLHATMPHMRDGFFGIYVPSFSTFFDLLFSPKRGWFFWSPALLLLIPGLIRLAKLDTKLFLTIWVSCGMHLLILSGFWEMEAGPTLGPRYFIAMLPILVFPIALGFQFYPIIAVILTGLSIILTAGGTAISATLPVEFSNPLINHLLPLAITRETETNNLGMLFGLPRYESAIAFLTVITIMLLLVSASSILYGRNLFAQYPKHTKAQITNNN